jgi:heavy metal sensor kinase
LLFRSIRLTLTLWYAVTLAVILVLFSSFFYLTFKRELFLEVDQELLAIAEGIASPTLEPFLHTPPSAFEQVLEDFIGPRIAGKFVQVLDASAKVATASKNLQDQGFAVRKEDLFKAAQGKIVYATVGGWEKQPLRIVSYPVMVNGRLAYLVQVGAPMMAAQEMLRKILIVLGVSIPLSLVLFGYGGWFLAGLSLKPVDILTRSAKKITAENLSQRLEVLNPHDEIGELAATFNNTLARLESAFSRMRQFSADVSHELRTPLTILRGETEVALRWVKEPEEYRAILQSNLEEIKRMSEIIEYLLDLAKAEEGMLRLEPSEVALNDLLNELVSQTKVLARQKGVVLVFEALYPVAVSGDRLRLRQIFLNLLDNAVKYTPAGGEVRVVLDSAEQSARVAVIDTGSGIPEEDLPYLFDRFYRVDKARNRADGGTGLGLSLSRSLAEAHGGRIEVVSQLGMGSVFTVYLPLPAVATDGA